MAGPVLSEHAKAQLARFARLSALGFLSGLALTGGKLSWASLWALLVGSGETAWREVYPVKALPDRITSVLAPPPDLPMAVDGDATLRTHPGYGAPMQGVEVKANADGTFPPVTISSPPPAAPEK